MVFRHSSTSEAYAVLGLEQGASLEAVKTAYKQLALRTHPDKNPDNPDATVQFQQVSSAYSVLLKHLDTSIPPPMPRGFHPFRPFRPHPHGSSYESDEEDDSEFEDDEYDSDEYYEDEEDLDFFMFLFEELLNGRANRFAGARFHSRGRERDTETEEQYQARVQRQREEQAAAARRRKDQEEAWKVRRQMEREAEVRAGAERRKQKADAKKAEADAARRSAAQKVRTQQQTSQILRSSVFTAARRGDAENVKKGVWEDGVDAAGGEIKPGMDVFVQVKPKDPKQTLLHLAVVNGDADLVVWLDRHNAEAEEYDSQNRTAFHLALQYGHIPIIRYFYDAYPPKDSDSAAVLHVSPHKPTKPLLRLAFDSGEPEIVWLVLDAGLADSKAVLDAWTWICAHDAQARAAFGSVGKCARFDVDKYEETRELLMSWGGFTPPPTPRGEEYETLPKGSKKKKGGAGAQAPTPPETPPARQSPPVSPSTPTQSDARPARGMGRGRGRGRGRARQHVST